MKSYYLMKMIFAILMVLLPACVQTCDVMGSRACGQKPEKEDRESDPIKYCVASRVYFECVHKKYRGCENKEKYETAMESIMKGIRKRVNDLLAFCSDKIEDYKFNIIWDTPKEPEVTDSVRGGGGTYALTAASKNGVPGSSPVQAPVINDACQLKAINDLCQPLMINVKFNPSWNTANKRGWCQQALAYYRCLKSRLDRCPQADVQNHFQQLEHYLEKQINISCPGGVEGCTRHSTDARCKIGTSQSSPSFAFVPFSHFLLQSVLQILLLLLMF